MNLGLEVVNWFNNVSTTRSTYEEQLQDLNRYLAPSSYGFNSRSGDGNVDRTNIFDSTPERASDDLASSLLGMLVSPIFDKFKLIPLDKRIAKRKDVADFLYTAREKISDHLTQTRSCFMKTAGNVMLQTVRYGDGPFLIHRDKAKKLVKFAALPKQEVYYQRDIYGEVMVFFRKVLMTPLQIKKEFDLSEAGYDVNQRNELEIKIKNEPNSEREILQAVYERKDVKVTGSLPKNKKYASVWVDIDKKVVLRESGFDYFPFYAPAWNLGPGEDYGRGPGHRALPDIITLNLMEKKNLAAAEVMVTPPLIMPYDIMDDDPDLSPAAINYINLSRAMFGTQFAKPEALNLIQNLPISVEMQDRKRQAILLAFYNDLLEDDKRVEMSATESQGRFNDRVRRFSGPFANLETEFLEPVVMNTYKALVEFGELTPPDDLKDIKVAFTTAMYEAQQAIRLQALQQATAILAQMSQLPPNLAGSYKQEELAPYVFKATGADTNLLEDPQVVRERAEQAEQIQQDQIDSKSFAQAARGARDLNQALQIGQGL